MLQYTNDPKLSTPKPIIGRKLAYRLRRIPARWRTELAVEFINGGLALKTLITKQACALTGASWRKVSARRRQLAGISETEWQARAIDRLIDRIVARGGLERLIARLDELTRPARAAE